MNPGIELDARVAAQVLGWRWFKVVSKAVLVPPGVAEEWDRHPSLYQPLTDPGTLQREHLDGLFFFDSSRGGEQMPKIPKFSQELGVAFLLVEHLTKARAQEARLHPERYPYFIPEEVPAQYAHHELSGPLIVDQQFGYESCFWTLNKGEIRARGTSPAHAICLAALQATASIKR